MKIISTCVLALFALSIFGQTQVLSLQNGVGIVEDSLGSVTLWENQIEGYGDATQSVSALGAEQMQETYPGKVTVGFVNDGSFLELEGTNASVSDNSYSVFYVGKVTAESGTASLIGNLDIDGAWSKSSGFRLVKLENGNVNFHYGISNAFKTIELSNIPGDSYFFIGFTIDADGDYLYFDSNSSLIVSGTGITPMIQNAEDIKLNLYEGKDDTSTGNQTEVVEITMFDGKLSDADFDAQYARLATEYADLVTAEFSVTDVLPAERTSLPVASPITVTCDQPIDATSTFPKVYIDKSETEVAGEWVLSPSNVLTFTPSENWPYNTLVTLEVVEGLVSTDGVAIDLTKETSYNFIVETDADYGDVEEILIDTMATVDYPQEGHVLPLKLAMPSNRTKKMPIHIWVHGGGWSGGTAESSSAANSPHRVYLAENLGVATLSISYRCKGSSGTFALAMEDIATAHRWAFDNADVYNFDTTQVFLSGGSAGGPLSALAAQQLDGVVGYIGLNGTFDFVNDDGCWGSGNDFEQEEPTAEYNSAIYNLRTPPPATILLHGEDDTTIPYSQSTLFAEAINAAGGEAEAVIYPGEVHAFFNEGKSAYEDVLIEIVNFMSDILDESDETAVDDNLAGENTMVLYPNPVAQGGILNVKTTSSFSEKVLRAQVINYLGQMQLDTSIEATSDVLSLNVDNLEQGLYILKLSGSQTSETLNFVVQ